MINAKTFTFFPDSREQMMVSNYTADDLAEAMDQHPDMSARFLHEQWRTDRKRVSYDALIKLAKSGDGSFNDVVGDMIMSGAMMRGMYDVDEESTKSFVGDTLELMVRAANNFPLEAEMPTQAAKELVAMRATVVQYITSSVTQYKARLN